MDMNKKQWSVCVCVCVRTSIYIYIVKIHIIILLLKEYTRETVTKNSNPFVTKNKLLGIYIYIYKEYLFLYGWIFLILITELSNE